MAIGDIHVNGPICIRCAKSTGSSPPTSVIGHTQEGIMLTKQPAWDDVKIDRYGPETIKERVSLGEKRFCEFELHTINRTNLEALMWLFSGTAGTLAAIGKKLSDLDGSSGSPYLLLESETDQDDFHLKHFKPIQVRQKFGGSHTIVNIRGEACLFTDSSDYFWDNDAVTSVSKDDVVEVTGAHDINYNSAALGRTMEGVELIIDYLWEDIGIDVKGRQTTAEAILRGLNLSLRFDLHAFDKTNYRKLMSNSISGSEFGILQAVGKLVSATIGKQLVLDSILAASGRDWTFNNFHIDAESSIDMGVKHTIAKIAGRVLPTDALVYYTTAAGS